MAEYRALWEKGAPRAIPTMCVLMIKPDKMLNPFHTKSQIVVLGNQEDHIWSKSETYAPVLWSKTICLILSMALEHHRYIKQKDCTKKLAIWPHFEFNYILNLYVLSMCFMPYRNWIVCTIYNAALMLFFILRKF
jgi:hypothetical protein